jgi:hypothetical protein
MQKTLKGRFHVESAMFYGSAHVFSMGSDWTSNLSTGDSRCDIRFSPKCQNNDENVRAERFFSLLKLPSRVYSVHSTAWTTVYIVNCRVILFYVGCYATQTVRLPLK